MNIFDLNGVVAVINTPFTSENKIDHESIGRYVESAIESGVSGFLVPAMAAEINKLTYEERISIVSTVMKSSKNRIPVIGGASGTSQTERISFVKDLESLGCHGVLVSIPFDDEKKYTTHIEEIAAEVSTFLVIQDWDFHGYGIPVDVIVSLFNRIDVFKSLKIEVVPAGKKYSDVIAATKDNLHVSGGWASSQMIEALDRGVHTFMSTIMHKLYIKIFDYHRSGNREKAKDLFQKIVPILAFSHQHLDISIHFNKRFYYKKGIFTTDKVREPIIPFDDYHMKVADELIELAFKLEREIIY